MQRTSRSTGTGCESGCQDSGDLPGYPAPVWFHPDGTAKILSLHLVKAHCRVQYDSDEDEHAAFHMTEVDDGSVTSDRQ
jgi:hypothetical protein